MHPAVFGGFRGVALEAMAAEHGAAEAGGGAACLDDARDSAGVDRLPADHVDRDSAGRRVSRPWCGPDAPEPPGRGDAGGDERQRASARTTNH